MPKPHNGIFIHLDKISECDRQTDGQNSSGYYSGLHCEQCAVKTIYLYSGMLTLQPTDQPQSLQAELARWLCLLGRCPEHPDVSPCSNNRQHHLVSPTGNTAFHRSTRRCTTWQLAEPCWIYCPCTKCMIMLQKTQHFILIQRLWRVQSNFNYHSYHNLMGWLG